MLSNFMKSKTKTKTKIAIPRIRSTGPHSASIVESERFEQQNKEINSSTSTNFDNTNFENTRISKTLPRSTKTRYNDEINNIQNNNYNNFDNYQNGKSHSALINNFESDNSSNFYQNNVESDYLNNYNQSSIVPSNSLISSNSSGSTVKYHSSNLRGDTYNSVKTIKYNELNQNIESSPIINSTHTLSKNVVTTSHPLPSAIHNTTTLNLNALPARPIRTVSNNLHSQPQKIQKMNESSLEISSSNGYLSPTLSDTRSNTTSRKDDSIRSGNTMEVYELYSSTTTNVNLTSSPYLNPPKFMDNFRSLSRNFKMKEFSTNPKPLSSASLNNSPNDSDFMSPTLNGESDEFDDTDDSDNEPLYNTYIRNKNKKIATPSLSSNSTSNYSQNSKHLYRNEYHSSNSSLSTNLSNKSSKNTLLVPKRNINPTSNSNTGINRRISRSQPNMTLSKTSNACKTYDTMIRNNNYSGNSSNASNLGNFTNVQELKPIAGTSKAKSLPRNENIFSAQFSQISNDITSPHFTPPLTYSQTNTHLLNDDPISVPEPPQAQLQVPINIGKRKQSLGCSAMFKEKNKNLSTTSMSPSVNKESKNDYNIINECTKSSNDTPTNSYSNSNVAAVVEESKPLSPQLKLLRHASNSPILKHKSLNSSPQLVATIEKPLVPSPILTSNNKAQKRSSNVSLNSLNNQKLLPSPLMTQKFQTMSSPQLASQSPLQSYVTLNGSSSSESSINYPITNTTASSESTLKNTIVTTTSKPVSSSPAFTNIAVLNDKIISPGPIKSTINNATNNIFSSNYDQNEIVSSFANSNIGNKNQLQNSTGRISSPKLLNNPFVKKDQELRNVFTHLNHSSPNLNTTMISTINTKISSSPKITSPITSPIASPITSPITSPKMLSSRITSPISTSRMSSSPRVPYSKNPILSNEVLNKNSYPSMPMSSFNYKSLARTPPITYAASITNSPTLSAQSTPKASSSAVVVNTNETERDQQNVLSNGCTINKRVSSFNIERQFQEQLQEQIQNSNSSIKSSKYDDFYILPSNSSVKTVSSNSTSNNGFYQQSNISNSSLSVPVDTKISPKLQQTVPLMTPITQPSTTSEGTRQKYGGLDRSKHIRHKRNVSFNDEKNKIIENKVSSDDLNNTNSDVGYENISNISVGTTENSNINKVRDSTSVEDEKLTNNSSSNPKKVVNTNLQLLNDQNNYISQAKSVHVSSIKKLSPIMKESVPNRKKSGHKHAISDGVENINPSYQSKINNNIGHEIINYSGGEKKEYESALVKNIVNQENINKIIYGKEQSDNIERNQFYVKTYKKLNNKELGYLQEVAYKQLKQSYPESAGFIKKDVLKALQQKTKNKGSSPKWWSYWKKESKNTSNCSVFKTSLNTSILYASVSLDSVDEENPRRIPIIIYKCVQYLKKYGLKKEGIFRVNGSERRIQATVKTFDEPPYLGPNSFEKLNVYDVAGLIKLYVRQLPDSLFPNDIYLPLLKYYDKYTNEKDRIKILQLFLMMFPRNYLILLEYLLDLFSLITKFSEYNQMTSSNLARIFAPNLLKPIPPSEPSLKDYGITSSIIEFMIDHDMDFHISRSESMLLKILQEIPDLSNKNPKAKKSNLHIPFMAINNIFSDNEETDDERSSKYSNSGEFTLSKYSPQLMNETSSKSPNLSDEKINNNSNGNSNSNNSNNNNVSNRGNMLNDSMSNNLSCKINNRIMKQGYNGLLTPPQTSSSSSPTQSTTIFSGIKSKLNTLSPNSESRIIETNLNNSNNNEETRSFSNLTIKRDATSFSVIRPNQKSIDKTPSDSNLSTDKTMTNVNLSKPKLNINVNPTQNIIVNTKNIVGLSSLPSPLSPSSTLNNLNGASITDSVSPLTPSINEKNNIESGDIIQHSNSKTIIRKNTIEESQNSSCSPSNDLSIERNNSSYSLNKSHQAAGEI